MLNRPPAVDLFSYQRPCAGRDASKEVFPPSREVFDPFQQLDG
jgi:hypothetical protein